MIELDINVVQKNIRQIRMTTYQKDFPRSAQDSDSRTPEHPRAFQDRKFAQLAHLFSVSTIWGKFMRWKQLNIYFESAKNVLLTDRNSIDQQVDIIDTSHNEFY